MNVYLVIDETGEVQAVVADQPRGALDWVVEVALHERFDGDQARWASEPPGPSDCLYVWEHLRIEGDEWEIIATCSQHPDETEPGVYQRGCIEVWEVR